MSRDISTNINLNNISKKIIITNSNNSKNKIGTTIIYNLTSFKQFLDVDTLKTKLNSNIISLNDMIYSNKIILSAKIENSTKYTENISLLSQHNILNNIAYYYKNNNLDNPNPRIIFKKSYLNNISNNNKLLNVINDDTIMKFNILNQEFDIDITSQGSYRYIIEKNIHITLNYYSNFKNSNYYKINLKDFYLHKNYLETDNTINSIDISNISINNNFSLNNNYNIDNSTLSTIFCISNNIVSKLSSFENILETDENGVTGPVPEYTIFNLSASYSATEDIRLYLSGKNITDLSYIGSRLHSNPGQPQPDLSSGILIGPRRQINLGLEYSF